LSFVASANLDRSGPMREACPVWTWAPGDYIVDEQTLRLDGQWNGGDDATFYLGAWRDQERMAVTAGPNDGNNRIEAASIAVPPRPGPPMRSVHE
jgi:hypothetical protein